MAAAVSADERWVAWLERKFPDTTDGNANLQVVYDQAAAAAQKQHTEVTITSLNLDGINGSGEIAGNPLELMAACEATLQNRETAKKSSRANVFNFGKRRTET